MVPSWFKASSEDTACMHAFDVVRDIPMHVYVGRNSGHGNGIAVNV